MVNEPALDVSPITKARLRVHVGTGHLWVDALRLMADEPGRAAWVLRELGSGTHAASDAALAARGLRPETRKVPMKLPSNGACIVAIKTGNRPSMCSAAPHIAQGL